MESTGIRSFAGLVSVTSLLYVYMRTISLAFARGQLFQPLDMSLGTNQQLPIFTVQYLT